MLALAGRAIALHECGSSVLVWWACVLFGNHRFHSADRKQDSKQQHTTFSISLTDTTAPMITPGGPIVYAEFLANGSAVVVASSDTFGCVSLDSNGVAVTPPQCLVHEPDDPVPTSIVSISSVTDDICLFVGGGAPKQQGAGTATTKPPIPVSIRSGSLDWTTLAVAYVRDGGVIVPIPIGDKILDVKRTKGFFLVSTATTCYVFKMSSSGLFYEVPHLATNPHCMAVYTYIH